MKIRNNLASLNALRHTSDNFKRINSSIEKLSSGTAINRGADGPAALINSERLRSNIAGIRQAYTNGQNSISMLQTAEGSLNEISAILIELKQLAVNSANEAINDEYMLEANQIEIDNLLKTVDRIVANTTFAGRSLLNGDLGVNGVAVGNHLQFVSATEETQSSPQKGFPVDITRLATRSSLKGTLPITVNNIGEGIFFFVNENGRNAKLDTLQKSELKNALDQIVTDHRSNPELLPEAQASAQIRNLLISSIQSTLDHAGLDVRVSEAPDQTLMFEHRQFGSAPSFSVTSSLQGVVGERANEAFQSLPGQDISGLLNDEPAEGTGQTLTGLTGSTTAGLSVRYTREVGLKEVPVYDETGHQIGREFVNETNEELVGSPSNPKIEGFIHISQQSRAFGLGPSLEDSASLKINNIRVNQLAQNIENKSDFKNLAGIDVRSLQGAKDSIKLIEKAIDEISRMRGRIGAFQKHTVERSLQSLKAQEEGNVLGESTIRDTDVASEMSKLTSNQIMFQSSQAMLAQANQLPEKVLSLMQS